MEITELQCCGSGSSGILFQVTTKDYSEFCTVLLPYKVNCIRSSGVISACLSEEKDLYYWCNNISKLIFSNVLSVACGWTHVLFVSPTGAYTYGKGSHGQLGLGSLQSVDTATPLHVQGQSVGCGFRTSFILDSSSVLVFGENHKYQLGLGHRSQVRIPTLNAHLPSLSQVTGGNRHTIGFKGKRLYVWGTNSFGQLCSKDPEIQIPRVVELGEEIKEIGSGWNHIAVLTVGGRLMTCGKGDLGQLGNGSFADHSELRTVLEGCDALACGSEHLLAAAHGSVYSWGWNEHGNLGLGDMQNRAQPSLLAIKTRKLFAGGAVSYCCNLIRN